MRKSYVWVFVGVAVLSIGYIEGCGKASAPGQAVSVIMKAVNYSQTASRSRGSLTATNTNNGVSNGIPATSILSGAPEAMTVYLQSISVSQSPITQSNNNFTSVWTSTASNTTASGTTVTGCALNLSSGTTDLSSCAGLGTLSIPAGNYTGVQLTFAEVGQVKGCIAGTFGTASTGAVCTGDIPNTSTPLSSGQYEYVSPFSPTPYYYLTDTGISTSTQYTFCTRHDKSYFNAETASGPTSPPGSITTSTPGYIGFNSDFQPTVSSYFSTLSDAEFVDIDLAAANFSGSTMAALKQGTVSITSANAFTVTTSGTTLTLAVDMNRIFEFFANTRTDCNQPNPQMHTGTSYFFTTKFQATGNGVPTSAVSAFAGEIGSVEGYQVLDASQGVAGWLTIFKDSSGNFLGGSMYEDDDNALTSMKGNVTVTSGSLATGATLSIDISQSTCTGFTSLTVVAPATGSPPAGSTGSCTLNWHNSTYPVTYTRLL